MKFVGIGIAALILLFTALALAPPAHAQTARLDFHAAAGVNGAWFDGPGTSFPVDAEVGGSAWSSLSPHLSAVAGLWYGTSHQYVRWQAGGRATVTDVSDPNFNVFLEVVAKGGSVASMKPVEWCPGAGFGWRPDPVHWKRFTITGEANYGMQSAKSSVAVGGRYAVL